MQNKTEPLPCRHLDWSWTKVYPPGKRQSHYEKVCDDCKLKIETREELPVPPSRPLPVGTQYARYCNIIDKDNKGADNRIICKWCKHSSGINRGRRYCYRMKKGVILEQPHRCESIEFTPDMVEFLKKGAIPILPPQTDDNRPLSEIYEDLHDFDA